MSLLQNILSTENTKQNAIIIDCETTGLDPKSDELLQLTIIDTMGTVLYNSYLRPTQHTDWYEAAQIHGITPDIVTDAPTITEAQEEIQKIMSNSDLIIGYNIYFDLSFLEAVGIDYSHLYDPDFQRYWIEDLMDLFSAIYGEWNSYYGSYTWKTLQVAASFYNYQWNGKAHDALEDCLATLHIWNCMREKGNIEKAYELLLTSYNSSV